jgi:hypothetical protein
LSNALTRHNAQRVRIVIDAETCAMYPAHRLADPDSLLAEVAAAEMLGLSTRTLQSWRIVGSGPAYVRAGRAIRYRRRDLLTWIDANTIRSVGETDDR